MLVGAREMVGGLFPKRGRAEQSKLKTDQRGASGDTADGSNQDNPKNAYYIHGLRHRF